ncbi:hypothetical protein G9A89_016966 [Geosiphon pyriformis]|nr:hypothetical protein G9A89_016966 [Geosiphon pyriformis]
MEVAFEHQVMSLLFNSTAKILTYIILQRTSTNKHHPKVAESENIGANHLEFAKSLFQHYCQYLGLNHNHISAESAFNFYVNEKISFLLGTLVNTESARETFYRELIQNTNLPTNHNFTSIITEINKEIEHHTQQRYPITYASKGKRKLQTPAKKNRIESPSNLSYHYTLGSVINISSTDMFSSIITSIFGQFLFQNFRISDLWKEAELEKEEEESEDQEFTYQHPITENSEVETPNFQTQQNLNLENPEIETPNHQRQNNPNPELINQQNLPPVIVINQLPINPIAKPIQQPLQLPPQQPVQQQLLQQPPNLDPMAYAPIAKLDNFTGKEDDAQVWLNNIEKAITANRWNDAQSLVNKPQDFNAFKVEFLRYFSNNNSINRLVNTFTTMKQKETEAVTTYLGCFHQNLHQVQAINANYFTAPQILNQFIYGLHSTFQDAVTHARDFESAESEANHTQAINLVMNGSSELDSKLENLHNDAIIKETLIVPKINHVHLHQPINSGNRKRVSATIVVNKDISKLTYSNQNQPTYLPVIQSSVYQSLVYQAPIYQPQLQIIYQQPQPQIIYQFQQIQTPPQSLPPNGTQRPKIIQQSWRSAIIVYQLIPSSLQQPSGLRQRSSGAGQPQNPNSQNYLSLLVILEDASTNNPAFAQRQPITSNIPPATITEDESLAAIFPFEFEETTATPLFSGAALEAKPITMMYTDAKVEGQSIKLILDSTDGATKTPIGEIDDFPFEVNGIMTLIKVLVMEANQYQALVGTPANISGLTYMCTSHVWPFQDSFKRETIDRTGERERKTYLGSLPKEPSSWEWKEEKGKGKKREEENTQANNTYIPYTYGQQQSLTYC